MKETGEESSGSDEEGEFVVGEVGELVDTECEIEGGCGVKEVPVVFEDEESLV